MWIHDLNDIATYVYTYNHTQYLLHMTSMFKGQFIDTKERCDRIQMHAVLADDPSVTHTSELTPVYEDILPPEKQNIKGTVLVSQQRT